jgi:hypothetical protein
MKRRRTAFLVALGIMAAVGLLAAQKPKADGHLLLLDWADKSSMATPPVAVLIQLGVRDDAPGPWAGKATVSGARVVHREGYHFRDGDKLTEPDGWEASSRRPIRVPPRQPAVARTEGIDPVGVVLHLADVQDDAELTIAMKPKEQGTAKVSLKDVLAGRRVPILGGSAAVRLISTATPVATDRTEDDFPAACYGPDGTLWVAYVAYHVKDDGSRAEQKAFREEPKDFKVLDQPEFGDQVMVKYNRGGKWSEPIAVTDAKQDIVRCAIAADGNGNVSVIYSASREGKHQVYARDINLRATGEGLPKADVGTEVRLSQDEGPDLNPVACTTQEGRIRAAYQHWLKRGLSVISPLTRSEKGWGAGVEEKGITLGGWFFTADGATNSADNVKSNSWHPSLVAGPAGEWMVATDGQVEDSYDVRVLGYAPGGFYTGPSAALSSRFEARPSLAYDPQGRLWIAYEEGPEQWGKDYGALVPNQGEPLYSRRSVRVVCLQDGKLFKPAAELPTSEVRKPNPAGIGEGKPVPNYERTPRYSSPRIGIDGKGRLWLTYRQKFGTRYSTIPGSYWMTFARRLDGDHWTDPIELHHSDGLLDSRPVLLPHKSGGLLVVHNTDGRYTTPETINNDIYLSYVNLPGDPVEPKLVPHDPGKKDDKLVTRAKAEREAVDRIRKYRVESGGKKYQLLRGEFHRHTEISWDGGPDGSLEDLFRYAIDAAALDWIGDGDHDNGAGREYSWWLVQKFTDAYHVAGHFTPMFSYERSVEYPQGHRNCVFARRGVRTLPRLADPESKAPTGISPDDTKMLYRYLKEFDGICAVHTSATGMGTDWRDNDPRVEPLVEIYQGDRMNYEYPGAPRSGYDPKGDKKPYQLGGWEPKGFIDHALKEKGYRFGFESSSDHWSTHISYCVVLAQAHDRQGILDGLKRRHVYGATDDIILDVRSGDHLMGDEFRSNAAPALEVNVVGTGPVARIDILKDSEVVETIKPGRAEYKGKWTDPRPTEGTHYYYVRVQQEDGQLAWASPMWVEYAK